MNTLRLSVLALSFVVVTRVGAADESIVVKGVVATAKGPLAHATVVLSPIDPKTGLAATVATRDGEMQNPKATTDTKGAFTATFPRSLFVEAPPCSHECLQFAPDRLGVMVWPDKEHGVPALEPAVVKIDPKAASVDLGRVVLEPMK
jgi:hypothetical protein